jgi:hypothetical protein
MLACVLAFRYGRLLFRMHAHDPFERGTVAALLAMCFYLFVLSQKQYTFISVPEPWWLWIIMAKIATLERRTLAAMQPEADVYDEHEGWEHPEHSVHPEPA